MAPRTLRDFDKDKGKLFFYVSKEIPSENFM